MDAIVQFAESITQADAYAVDELVEALRQDGLTPVVEKAPPTLGYKDGGLTLAISLVGLGLSAISTLVSVLSFWRPTHPEYTITMKREELEIDIVNPTARQIREASAALASPGGDSPTIISITKA